MTTIILKSGHKANVTKLSYHPPGLESSFDYKEFWRIELNAKTFYAGRGAELAKREIVIWYPTGKMWSSFGLTLKSAFQGACDDAFLNI